MADIDDWDVVASNNNSPAPDGLPEGSTSLGQLNNWGRETMAVAARAYLDCNGSLVTTNSGNNYSISLNRSTIAAYAQGLTFAATINSTNTGNVTMNVNLIGAKSVVYQDGTQIPSGTFTENKVAVFTYDADGDRIILLSPLSAPYVDPLTTRGDILVRGASATARYALGAAKTYLRSDGTDALWASLLASDMTISSIADGDILQADSGFFSRLALGTADQVPHVNSGATALEYRNRPGVVIFGTKTLSGSADHTWSSLPSDVLSYDVWISNASLNGDSEMTLQLGTSGGVETSGYSGNVVQIGIGGFPFSTAFQLVRAQLATATYSGLISMRNITGNTWTISGHIMRDNNDIWQVVGNKTLSGVLTQIKLGNNGVDLFDSGYASLDGKR